MAVKLNFLRGFFTTGILPLTGSFYILSLQTPLLLGLLYKRYIVHVHCSKKRFVENNQRETSKHEPYGLKESGLTMKITVI